MVRYMQVAMATALLMGIVPASAFVANPGSNTVLVPRSRFHALASRNCNAVRSIPFTAIMASIEVDSEAGVIDGQDAPTAEPVAESSEPKLSLGSLVVGEEYQGIVNNVVSYGAFVDIGAEVNGLVHISQMADEFVQTTADIVTDGQTVTVKVMAVDEEEKKLVLSMRQNPRPARQRGDVSKYTAMLAEDPGQFMSGTVESIVSYGAFVNLGDDVSGFLHISQLKPRGQRVDEVTEVLTIGDEVQVRIRDVDEKLQRVNLSLTPVEEGSFTSKDVAPLLSLDRDTFHKGTVSSLQDYGMFVNVNGVDGLLHISKIQAEGRLSADEMRARYTEGQEVEVRILDVDEAANKVSLSMVEDQPEPDLSRFMELGADEWLEGPVVSITEYGAFVNLGEGVDGMVHISQLGGNKVDSVSDAVEVGQVVKVRVIEVVPEQRKVRLSMRTSNGPRRTRNVEKYVDTPEDEWLTGTVRTITNFGAFVSLDENNDGLVHISQISDGHVDAVEDVLTIGQEVQVRVTEVDTSAGRIGLSMKAPGSGGGGRGGGRSARKDVSAFVNYSPEEYIPGKVVSTTGYGAFVEIAPGVDGLVHISQLTEGRVERTEDVVQIGQDVQVRITSLDEEAGTVSLSMVAPRDNDDEAKPRNNSNRQPLAYDEGSDSKAAGEADWQKYLNQVREDLPIIVLFFAEVIKC
ncbi:unnamed protein product [Chrysoparadoxa australica]